MPVQYWNYRETNLLGDFEKCPLCMHVERFVQIIIQEGPLSEVLLYF